MLLEQLETYRKLVVLTGSELSLASRAPVLFGVSGLWQQPETSWLSFSSVLSENLAEMWRVFGPMRQQILQSKPVAAHHALAWLEHSLSPKQTLTLMTCNVDGLHQRAGSRRVIELYGSLITSRCTNPSCQLTAFEDQHRHDQALAYCPLCRTPLRPNIRFLDEPLPVATSWQVSRVLQNVEFFMVIGIDSLSQSVLEMIQTARSRKAKCILINSKSITADEDLFEKEFLGPVNELIPFLLGYKPKTTR